jgi:hypothetical protein
LSRIIMGFPGGWAVLASPVIWWQCLPLDVTGCGRQRRVS